MCEIDKKGGHVLMDHVQQCASTIYPIVDVGRIVWCRDIEEAAPKDKAQKLHQRPVHALTIQLYRTAQHHTLYGYCSDVASSTSDEAPTIIQHTARFGYRSSPLVLPRQRARLTVPLDAILPPF